MARPDVVRHLETGLLYDPATSTACARAVATRWSARPAAARCSARAAASSPLRDWTDAVDELVDVHYAALSATADLSGLTGRDSA